MLERFYPNEYVNSVYEVDFQMYRDRGIRGIMFDIDNTLVPHGAPATEESVELFKKLHEMGFETCLISNNKEPRVKPFADAMNTKYIYDSKKPSTRSYLKAMEIMNTDAGNTVFVGDQLFTDIYGANRAGLPSILVKPIGKKEDIQIVLKRYLERIVLWRWKHLGRYKG